MNLLIFGAKSMALSVYYAIQALYPDQKIKGFLVSAYKENLVKLAGLPVREIAVMSEDYCVWVFPLLSRIEELSVSKGQERTDRYIAYISESLLTLYFRYHRELKLYHTGRQMYV